MPSNPTGKPNQTNLKDYITEEDNKPLLWFIDLFKIRKEVKTVMMTDRLNYSGFKNKN